MRLSSKGRYAVMALVDLARFNEIKIRLSELSSKFSNNILDYIKDFELVIDSSDKNI